MKQEPNNGIDLLLRQLGRREDAFASRGDAQHLDADELSSYVANALPAKARARYMQHLADCSSCRKMVAQLSAAEGAVAVQQPATVVGPSGFKSFLASLFSPMVLRYAIPALGVIVLTVVGVIVLRPEQRDSSVAQVQEGTAHQNKLAAETPVAVATPTAEFRDEGQPAKEVPKAGVIARAPAPETTSAPPPSKAAPAEDAAKQPEPEKKTAAAVEEKAAARDAIQTFGTSGRADQAVKKEKREADEVATAAPAPAAASGNKAPERRPAKTVAAAGAGGVASVGNATQSRQDLRRSRQQEAEGNFATAETRTVAGREFRKQGDVWIDVAYNSSQATTTLTRGTEQYRALVADEPAIHTIAENLKSEFVVVWKGRAYRVR